MKLHYRGVVYEQAAPAQGIVGKEMGKYWGVKWRSLPVSIDRSPNSLVWLKYRGIMYWIVRN